jgi:microcystin-dependent protein
MADVIQIRRDYPGAWSTINPTLRSGELGVELTTLRLKIGDGSTNWNILPYVGGGASISNLTDLTDVQVSSEAIEDILSFNGTSWENTPFNQLESRCVLTYNSGTRVFTYTNESGITEIFNLGLANINNTSDINKPISTATQTALDGKQTTLVSTSNIKSLNSISLLGSGNIEVASVIRGTNLAALNSLPAGSKSIANIYITLDTNYTYRWDTTTSTFIQTSPSTGVPTGTILQGVWGIASIGNLSVPSGYWPLDGTVVNSAGSPLHGITMPDTRGKVLANAKVSGGAAGTSSGSETTTLSQSNLPNVVISPTATYTPTGSITINSTNVDDTYPAAAPFNFDGTGSSSNIGRTGNQLDKTRSHSHTGSFTGTSTTITSSFNLNNNVTQTTIDNRQLTYYITQIIKL